MKPLNFTKMHGLGNDFMVVDNRDGLIEFGAEQVRRWSDRRTGIGFDQLLVVEQARVTEAEFDYRIYNADGIEVEHCGNGARCFARYVSERGLTANRSIKVNTSGGVLTLELQENGDVTVRMGVPEFEPSRIPFIAEAEADRYSLDVDGETFVVGAVAIANPHVLLMVDDVDSVDVDRLGPLIESHSRFPKRVNVGFMQRISASHIRLRVYERGVGETRACGTGACAAAAIGHRLGLLNSQVTVSLTGGDLAIFWPELHASIEMTGPCSTVFEGQTRM